jgi:hypothetical protein
MIQPLKFARTSVHMNALAADNAELCVQLDDRDTVSTLTFTPSLE